MPRSYRNARHVLTSSSSPKILNFSMAMDKANRQKSPQVKQEPEMMLDDYGDVDLVGEPFSHFVMSFKLLKYYFAAIPSGSC